MLTHNILIAAQFATLQDSLLLTWGSTDANNLQLYHPDDETARIGGNFETNMVYNWCYYFGYIRSLRSNRGTYCYDTMIPWS